jgi:hypothetical protein
MKVLAVGLVTLLLLGTVAISCSDSDSPTTEPVTEDEVRTEVYDIFCEALAGALALFMQTDRITSSEREARERIQREADSLRPESWQFERVEDGLWHIQGPGFVERVLEEQTIRGYAGMDPGQQVRALRAAPLLSAADWEHTCEHAKEREILTESGDRLESILCQEPTPGLWVFYERDKSLMPYDEAAHLWAGEARFGVGYGKLKASEAED